MSSSFLCYLGDVRVGATVLALTPMEEARPHATANSRRPFNDDLLLIGRRRFAFYDLLSTAPIRCPFYPLPRTLLILLAFLLFCIDMLVFFFQPRYNWVRPSSIGCHQVCSKFHWYFLISLEVPWHTTWLILVFLGLIVSAS